VAQPDTYIRGKDQFIKVSVQRRSGDEDITAKLLQKESSYDLTASKPTGHDYQLNLPPAMSLFGTLRLGDLTISLSQGGRDADPKTIHLTQPINYNLPIVLTSSYVRKDDFSLVTTLNLANYTLYGLGVGTLYGNGDFRKVRRFELNMMGSLSELTSSDFVSGTRSSTAQIGTATSTVYLSQLPATSNNNIFRCPAQREPVAMCTDSFWSLPTTTAVMSVTPDGARMVLSDKTGMLSWGKLPMSVPASWYSVGTTDPESSTAAGVRLAVTDLNGDKLSDLIAVWLSGGQQQVRAFLATTDGFAKDDALSMQLSAAIGQTSITALAAADVDNDGFGDVVIAQGQKLTVLQSQLDVFVPAWSAMVAPAGNTTINAIAVGRLDATSTPDKTLDIVTASNSGYNPDQNTLYLHAFRPQ